MSESLTEEQAFLLIANIMKAAEWGAWAAQSLKSSKFSSIPKIKKISIKYLQYDKVAAKANYKELGHSDEDFNHLVHEQLFDLDS